MFRHAAGGPRRLDDARVACGEGLGAALQVLEQLRLALELGRDAIDSACHVDDLGRHGAGFLGNAGDHVSAVEFDMDPSRLLSAGDVRRRLLK